MLEACRFTLTLWWLL